MGDNQTELWQVVAKGPNTKTQSLLYPGRGKEEEEEEGNLIESRNLGREGEAQKRWAAGPLLLSRAHFLEKFFEGPWMEWER